MMKVEQNELNKILYAYVSKGNPLQLNDAFETYVRDGYAGNVNIYPIIRIIVDSATGVKWVVKDKKTDEIAEGTELEQLIKKPNDSEMFNDLLDQLITWKLITGNRYIYWLGPQAGANKGKPMQIYALPAANVEIISGGWLMPIDEYRLTIGDTIKRLPASNVIHGRTFNPTFATDGSQLYGQPPLKAALAELTASKAAYNGLSKQFENGGPDVIITNTEGMVKGQPEYTEEQRLTLWSAFKSRFGGSKNKGRWLIKNHPVEVHEIGKSPVDMNTLEFLKLTVRDLCNIYHVPSVLMNDTEYSTYNNMKEARKSLWYDAVIPELEHLKDDLNKLANIYNQVSNTELYFDYDLSDVIELQEDLSTQAAGLQSAYWLTINEKRQAMGLEPIDGADELLLPMGLMPYYDVVAPVDGMNKANEYLDVRGIKY